MRKRDRDRAVALARERGEVDPRSYGSQSGRYFEGYFNRRIVANCGWSALPTATATARSGPQTSIGIPSFNATRRNRDKRGGAENPHIAEIADEQIREAEARRRVRDVRISQFFTLAHAFAERDGTS